MIPSKKLLIIGFVWPEPASSAAGSRMMQLIRFFKDDDWQITFASTANASRYMENLGVFDIQTETIKMNDQSFDEFIITLNPQMVLFDRFMTEEQFGWRVHACTPDAIRVLDMEDLHCLRYGREKAVKDGLEFTSDYLFSDFAKREVASVYRSDLSLIISEAEVDLLIHHFGVHSELLFYLPYMLDPINQEHIQSRPSYEEREGFVSIGNFRHKPNLDAVLYLKKELWPAIRNELPGAELRIFGAYPSRKVKQWHDPSAGFLVKGRAKDAKTELSKARVCLAPLRFGAGLKGKLVESMQCGTPSVTTSVGAEGINGEFPWPGDITDDPQTFVQSAIRFYTDRSAWLKAQQQCVAIINQRFPAKVFRQKLRERLDGLLNDIGKHRRQNFTGAMLMHHTMASTRFMSRWIEEKNREV